VHLVRQYLNRLKIPVSEEDVDRGIADIERNLKSEGKSLAEALVENNKSLDELRKELSDRSRWINYVKQKATDATLKKFVESHKDALNGTQVRASHILIKSEPQASAAEKERARQKLLGIKRDIQAKKSTFAQAANKYSEDPANAEGAGGDIGYFRMNSGIVEEFGKAAFALKPGEISDPVETAYGHHLIVVTDRKEGAPVDIEQHKSLILTTYAAELQKELLTAQRKSAKIDIKPMPADLFPPAAPPTIDSAVQPKAETKGAAQPK
jgi:peptidyl-prolyl cis-trans isomerase C